MPNASSKWKVPTPLAGETFDPPLDMQTLVQAIENEANGAAQLVANAAARDAIPTAQKYVGKRVRLLSDNSEYDWTGAAWVYRGGLDTGWMPITLDAAFSGPGSAKVRRIGQLASIQNVFTATAAGTLGSSFVTLGTVDAQFRPASFAPIAVSSSLPVPIQGFVQTSGQIQIRTFASGGVGYTSSSTIGIGTPWMLG